MREELVAESENATKRDREAAERALSEVSVLYTETNERLRTIELSGKTIGHYARGIQKIFDEKGIKLDFLKLLQQIK